MAEVKKEEEKTESEVDFDKLIKFASSLFAILLIILLIYVVIFQNPQTMFKFVQFLIFLEVILGFYLVFILYKLFVNIKSHAYWATKMGDWYTEKYKPEVKSEIESNPNRVRFDRAKAHIGSSYKEEWKIGVIELDNILRDLLKQNKYVGETVGDLLNDAGKKGFRSLDTAWEAHTVRNKIVHEGTNYSFGKEEAEKVLRKYSEVFEDLGI